jgi:hypothetical protein
MEQLTKRSFVISYISPLIVDTMDLLRSIIQGDPRLRIIKYTEWFTNGMYYKIQQEVSTNTEWLWDTFSAYPEGGSVKDNTRQLIQNMVL